MIIISHRGNLDGPREELENNPKQIERSFDFGFDCEVDLWLQKSDIYLGHDAPQFQVTLKWLKKHSDRLWIHCKDPTSLEYLTALDDKFNFFWHEKDRHTLTSRGFIWSHPNSVVLKNSIAVLPEQWMLHENSETLSNYYGVCTDFPLEYRSALD